MKVLTVDVHFLGKPVIYHNKLEVNIRQRKLLAVLLYLIYNRQCSRDELISIFWDNLDEESARQNLRNAIYRLRKILGTEFFNVKESVISISKHIKLICDTDDLVSEDGGLQILDLDNVVFLDQLYLKDEGSRNGTYLNGERIDRPVVIQRDDIIGIGETRLEVQRILRESES